MRHAALDGHAQVRDVVRELDRVVLARPDRLGEVLADLLGVDVERRRELDVADVLAEVHVHEAGDGLRRGRRRGGGWTPWTKALAQLPTPMMATRTFSLWYWLPPLVDGAWPMCEVKFVNLRRKCCAA